MNEFAKPIASRNKYRPLKEVCPICWRSNCRLFIRMTGLRFTDEEKKRFFREFHRDVCGACKKLSCKDKKTCPIKKFNTKKLSSPKWWTDA